MFFFFFFFIFFFFFFNDTATTEIYTLSLHDALPRLAAHAPWHRAGDLLRARVGLDRWCPGGRSWPLARALDGDPARDAGPAPGLPRSRPLADPQCLAGGGGRP